jgi:hypothetical protein
MLYCVPKSITAFMLTPCHMTIISKIKQSIDGSFNLMMPTFPIERPIHKSTTSAINYQHRHANDVSNLNRVGQRRPPICHNYNT